MLGIRKEKGRKKYKYRRNVVTLLLPLNNSFPKCFFSSKKGFLVAYDPNLLPPNLQVWQKSPETGFLERSSVLTPQLQATAPSPEQHKTLTPFLLRTFN